MHCMAAKEHVRSESTVCAVAFWQFFTVDYSYRGEDVPIPLVVAAVCRTSPSGTKGLCQGCDFVKRFFTNTPDHRCVLCLMSIQRLVTGVGLK